ncbi:NmrA/HSCARG family protein [Accumulibacter sp.]|uniref:NmrA/HSCARG family protein n=1 Tax=Accumulibacter sp. TaxID=2053492 RepID=UPI002632A562|nr:NmrA/HSCARG family protein [Accumulibacter sp.]
MSTSNKIIAVVGATGNQGGGVVRALQKSQQFHVRALTRNPSKHRELGDEVVEADLSRPETLKIAFEGAYGVFAVTNFWETGTDEWAQGMAAVDAARAAGVEHFIWSTLPNVDKISGGAFDVPHFTYKARVDELVRQAGFAHHTFVVAPFFYQNLNGMLAPELQPDGSAAWTLPIDPTVKAIHMGDITELGAVVTGAFSNPAAAGNGQYLPLVGSLLSFDDIVGTLNGQGHKIAFNQVPVDVFSTFFDGAAELAQMFAYFEKHTYLGSNHDRQIKLANEIAGKPATDFANWAKTSFSMPAAANPT